MNPAPRLNSRGFRVITIWDCFFTSSTGYPWLLWGWVNPISRSWREVKPAFPKFPPSRDFFHFRFLKFANEEVRARGIMAFPVHFADDFSCSVRFLRRFSRRNPLDVHASAVAAAPYPSLPEPIERSEHKDERDEADAGVGDVEVIIVDVCHRCFLLLVRVEFGCIGKL